MKKFLFLALIVCACVACDSDNALLVISQEEDIQNYIDSNYPENEVVRNNGSNRVIISDGYDKLKVAAGDSVTLLIEGYVFDSAPVSQFFSDSVTVLMDKSELVQGLYDGLTGASLYEQSLILFSAKYGFYDKQAGLIPSMSALLYNVLITDIK